MNEQRRFILFLLSALVCFPAALAQGKITYSRGWLWDSWNVRNKPANRQFDVQLHHRRCRWRTVDSGKTNSSGADSGSIIHWGPGDGASPFDNGVRIHFWSCTYQRGRYNPLNLSLNVNVDCPISDHVFGVPSVGGPHVITIRQNDPELILLTGEAAWFRDATWFSLRLPEHFRFMALPTVVPLGGDLLIGPPILEGEDRILSVPIVANARLDPQSGIQILDALIGYDGIAPSSYYWPEITASFDRTPASDPFNPIEQRQGVGYYRGMCVHPEPWLQWFDETAGGAGYPTFLDLAAAYQDWLGQPDQEVSFEGVPLGTKITEQYDNIGIWFTGTDGGNYNNLTGVQQEGDPNLVQNLTGYDGSYQPDGSLVYVRFQNTVENPDAPLTFTFDMLQRKVGAFIGCGVEGTDHSFTVTAYDDQDQPIGSRVYTAELWEPDPTGENYETFFGIEAAFPCIRTVSIMNNSLVEFADVLIIDNVAWAAWPATLLGDHDKDNDVDLFDYGEYLGCFSGPRDGPGFTVPSIECLETFDSDGDADVDRTDFAGFQISFTGMPSD